MPVVKTNRQMPTEWTNAQLYELHSHARYLGQEGNPAGWLFTIHAFPYVGAKNQYGRFVRSSAKWDYEGLRRYVYKHSDEVANVWQYDVRSNSY